MPTDWMPRRAPKEKIVEEPKWGVVTAVTPGPPVYVDVQLSPEQFSQSFQTVKSITDTDVEVGETVYLLKIGARWYVVDVLPAPS